MSTWALWAHSFTHSLCDEVSRTLLNMRLPAHLSTGRGVRPYFRSLWWSPEIAFFPWDCRREGALDGEGRDSLSPAPLRLQSAPWFMGQNLPRCLCVREAKIHTETGGYGEMLLTAARCIGCIRMKMGNLSVCVCVDVAGMRPERPCVMDDYFLLFLQLFEWLNRCEIWLRETPESFSHSGDL